MLNIADKIDNIRLDGRDVIFEIGKGSITLENAKNKKFKGDLAVDDYKKTVKTIDASVTRKSLTIEGNSLANEIIGGAGNDKISGNEDADKIWGNNCNDTIDGGTLTKK